MRSMAWQGEAREASRKGLLPTTSLPCGHEAESVSLASRKAIDATNKMSLHVCLQHCCQQEGAVRVTMLQVQCIHC